jgi:hypothetical protein
MKLAGVQLALAAAMIVSGVAAAAQTISPPVAEFRGRVNGMYELRNDSDKPMAVILEVVGFAVSESGVLAYTVPDPDIRVELGTKSFEIPPHQSRMVFYKAVSERPNAWFAVLNTLAEARANRTGMRVHLVLPHIVYLYQKQKLKKNDLRVELAQATEQGKYTFRVVNQSDKLSRVTRVEFRGFDGSPGIPPFPIFPGKERKQVFAASAASPTARAKVFLEDGFALEVRLAE